MANNSYSFGEVNFVGNWTEDILEYFTNVFNKHLAGGYYNIEISDIDSESKSGIIQGTGRWHFLNNLNFMDNWAKEDSPEEWVELAKEMYDRDLYLEIEFVDKECGVGILYRCDGNIAPILDDQGEFCIVFNYSSEENFEYTRENLIAQKLYIETDFEISLKEVGKFLEKEKHLSLPDSDSQLPKINNVVFENIKIQLNEQPWADSPEEILEEAGFFDTV